MCGTDTSLYRGKPGPWSVYPLIPGHEIIGTVERLGSDAGELLVEEGQRVAVDEVLRCGSCRACRMLDPRCSRMRVYGATFELDPAEGLFGGYGEYMTILPRTNLHPVPTGVASQDLTLFEPLANAIDWVDKIGVALGDRAVVQGPGHQGLAIAQVLLNAGASPLIVTGTSRGATRLDAARQMGAVIIDVDEEDPVDVVAELTGGHMADVVFDATGGTSDTAGLSMKLVRAGGSVALVGLKGNHLDGVAYDDVVNRSVRVQGFAGCAPAAMPAALALLGSGQVATDALRGVVVSLDAFDEAIDMLTRSSPGSAVTRLTMTHFPT
jgi:alcohol dehydrogenase